MTPCFSVQVFFAEHARGNRAECFILPKAAADAVMATVSMRSQFTCCFCWPQQDGVAIVCYQRGYRIGFCGHGLLACAALQLNLAVLWQNFCEKSAISTSSLRTICRELVEGKAGSWQRRSDREACHLDIFDHSQWRGANWRDGRVELQVPRIFCREIPLPISIGDWMQPDPVAAALAGLDDGYRIFIWPPGTDIASVVIDRKFLLSGNRATILSARHAGPEADFTQRYLAPQYGVEEDAATGSATVVLADYWVRRALPPRLRAWQRSQGGGVIDSEVYSDAVAISGAVALEDISPWDVEF